MLHVNRALAFPMYLTVLSPTGRSGLEKLSEGWGGSHFGGSVAEARSLWPAIRPAPPLFWLLNYLRQPERHPLVGGVFLVNMRPPK
jgi:hypothetical protein